MRSAVLGLLVAAVAASATNIYVEVGDAGQLLGTAQIVNTLPGAELDAIQGNLEAGGADLFQIFLTGGQTFSATTTASSIAFNNFDSQLMLFDSSGIGVYANDDDPNSPPQSTLLAGVTLTPAASSIYYLAIGGDGFMPTSLAGLIFPVSGGILDQSGDPANGQVGPTGAGGASPLNGWSSTSSENGAYEIVLTGAEFVGAAATPEPATAGLIGMGIFCGVLRRRWARKNRP
jgi:hypothetical protein